ncbi:hypothetical protein B0H14DRAFT_3574541 [Mycena olivaceomarginata]|nr:hypothetical protein B0H14DRAFT_3574541 [Mycena olivaceomarginata]
MAFWPEAKARETLVDAAPSPPTHLGYRRRRCLLTASTRVCAATPVPSPRRCSAISPCAAHPVPPHAGPPPVPRTRLLSRCHLSLPPDHWVSTSHPRCLCTSTSDAAASTTRAPTLTGNIPQNPRRPPRQHRRAPRNPQRHRAHVKYVRPRPSRLPPRRARNFELDLDANVALEEDGDKGGKPNGKSR